MTIRFVEPKDAVQILDIYQPFILRTSVSFETEVPSLEAFQNRIENYAEKAPWLVAEENNTIIGYAYATVHRSRQAYQWNQEVTAYTHPEHLRKGVAKALYLKLLSYLKKMGYAKAIAIITLPNDPSLKFHQALGFQLIGIMKNVGYKFNQWHDTSWWDIQLQNSAYQPTSIWTMDQLKAVVNG